MKITEFNKQNIKEVRAKIDEALKLLEEAGIKAEIGNINFNTGEVRTKLTCHILNTEPKENKMDVARVVAAGTNNIRNMSNEDIAKSYFGAIVEIQGKTLKLDDYKPRNTKYPFIVGKYKLSRAQLLDNIVIN